MPIFEYRCKSCGHRFSELIFGSEKPTCPECGGHSAEKQISGFGVGGSSGGGHGHAGPCGSGGL